MIGSAGIFKHENRAIFTYPVICLSYESYIAKKRRPFSGRRFCTALLFQSHLGGGKKGLRV